MLILTITVTNVDEGEARFNVTSDNDITAPVVGDVMTVACEHHLILMVMVHSATSGSVMVVIIAGATSTSYTVAKDDEGTALRVAVSYTDGGGTNEVVTTSGVTVPVDMYATAIIVGYPI